MIAQDERIFDHRHAVVIVALATVTTMFLSLWPVRSAAFLATLVGLVVFSFIASKNVSNLVFIVLFTVLWFPEASQTKDVYTALEAPSIYNYRPIPALYASVFDYLFAAVVLAWMASVLFSLRGRQELRKVPLFRSMLTFLGLSAFSLIYGLLRGGELYYAMREFRVSAYFVFVYLMVVTMMRSETAQRRLAQVILGTALLIGIYGVIRFVLGMGKEFGDIRILFYDIGDSIAMFVALFVILSGFLTGRIRGATSTIKALAFTAPILFSFVFSYRRGAWLAFLVGLVFLLLFAPVASGIRRRMLTKGVVIVILLVMGGAGILLLRESAVQSVVQRFTSISNFTDDTSNLFRIFDALNAFYTFLHHPILGTGYGGRYDFVFYSTLVAPAEFWDSVSRTCHDGYLYIMYKMGLVGFVSYMAIFIGFFVQWFRSRSRPTDLFQQTMAGALGASVLAILANNVTSPVSDSIRPALTLAFVMGFAAVIFEGNRGVVVRPRAYTGPNHDLSTVRTRATEASASSK